MSQSPEKCLLNNIRYTCNRGDLRDVEYRGGYYYAMYGHDIVASYRTKYKQKFPGNPLFKKKEPSFVEFVEYLIETPLDKYDEHWKPIFVLCPPCHFNFDIIVKMETFKRDTEFLLDQRGRMDSKEINLLASLRLIVHLIFYK